MKDNMTVTALTDDELRAQILAFGIDAGPVLKTTRRVYQITLEKLLNEVHFDAKTRRISPEKPEVHVDAKTRRISPEKPEVQKVLEPEVKQKRVEKVFSPPVEETREEDDWDVPENISRYEENSSPEPEIPRPSAAVNYTSKSSTFSFESPVKSPNLPEYRRPPLKSSWRDMDLSGDYSFSRGELTHRKDGSKKGDSVDSKATKKSNGKEETKTESGGSKLSVFMQIVVLLIACLIVFVIFSNMEPAGKNPFQKGITSD